MIKSNLILQNSPWLVGKQIFFRCIPVCHMGNVSQKERSRKQLHKLQKQQIVSKNIELASRTLREPGENIEFIEYPYEKVISVGEKKDVSVSLPKKYSPEFVETYWYEWWEKQGYFSPRKNKENDDSKIFSMVIPPPNVTGNLHIGHALTSAIEDTIARWRSMSGDEVLWLPGSDHAGIATQVVVERHLEQEHGETRFDLGPEKFREAVWKWKENKGDNIYRQLRKLGSSLDWDRSVFTLDEKYAHAVKEAFIRLFKEGLIYRDECCVNWCCHLQSTVSDLEVESKLLEEPTLILVPGYEHPIQFGVMHQIAYKLCEPVGDISEIVVGTTRLETVVGDEAVAVHPDDPRYSSLIGKHLYHPVRYEKTIPIIADEAVEKDFGTGAMKVTPAHDFTDFEIAKRHGLPIVPVIDSSGVLDYEKSNIDERYTKNYRFINNKPRFAAREAIRKHLANRGFNRGTIPQRTVLRLCSRSGDVIEPMVKEQWFVRTTEMAKAALEVFESGELNFIQKSMFENQWRNWLSKTTPWCISRQIWWGHQIPAYKCTNTKTRESLWLAAHSHSDALKEATLKFPTTKNEFLKIVQDTDVLDTWFSSALHPFASLGWPKQTDDLQRYYPLSLMETGSDLIYFWVARMVMLGLKLTGQVPFRNVLFHPMVRDKFNRKMSKSVGNVVDPLHVISGVDVQRRVEELKEFDLRTDDTFKAVNIMKNRMGGNIPRCGSDALRMALLLPSLESQGIGFDVMEAITARRFCNKVWNSAYFVLQYITDDPLYVEKIQEVRSAKREPTDFDSWIKSLLLITAENCNKAMEEYSLTEALQHVKKLWVDISAIYYRYCYFQLTKNVEEIDQDSNRVTDELMNNQSKMGLVVNMIDVLETTLRFTAPFAPFLAEELWQRIPGSLLDGEKPESISLTSYPSVHNIKETRNFAAELIIDQMWKAVEKVRQEKILHSIPNNLDIIIVCKTDELHQGFTRITQYMNVWCNCNKIEVHQFESLEKLKETCFGNVNENDDVIVMYRLSPSEFQTYLLERNMDEYFQLRKQQWINKVEKLEARARKANESEQFKRSCNEIVKECEKYLKIERFAKSIEIVKPKMKTS